MRLTKNIFELIFPKDIFEWFELTEGKEEGKVACFTFVEKDIPQLTEEQKKKKIIGRKFHDITVSDFPLRGRKTVLIFRRRYWRIEGESTYLKRDITITHSGTQLEKEFAVFLKGRS